MTDSMGAKIRTLRCQLGLTQEQLASGDLTRAYISMVETGKAVPSLSKLALLAQRLGRPVTYFVSSNTGSLQGLVEEKLAAAEEAVAQHAYGEAVAAGLEGLKLALEWGDRAEEARARLVLAEALLYQGEAREARGHVQWLLQDAMAGADPSYLVQVQLLQAHIAMALSDWRFAQSLYRSVVQRCGGRKRLQEYELQAKVYLGTCQFHLGDYGGAMQIYRRSVELARQLSAPELLGEGLMGLGMACKQLRRYDEGREATQEAIKVFQCLGSPALVQAEHNLALFELQRGNLVQASVLLGRCVQAYRHQRRWPQAASALEDLAEIALAAQHYAQAEACIREGLALLMRGDSQVLTRARLYRVLGKVIALRGEPEQGQAYLLMAAELFAVGQATAEEQETQALALRLGLTV